MTCLLVAKCHQGNSSLTGKWSSGFIVTGRNKGQMEKETLDIGFDAMIGGNGAYIEYHNHILKEITLSEQNVKEIIINYLEHHHPACFIEAAMVSTAPLPLKNVAARP